MDRVGQQLPASSCRWPDAQVFEVDSRELLDRKKALLVAGDKAAAAGGRSGSGCGSSSTASTPPSQRVARPTFVTCDWSNIKTLVPALVSRAPPRQCRS